ncbi:MAG: serine/threonine-protein kinase [Acidobacteriota bacterium]|nr:serine/threonine protein kinase [Blastocatellia bacterium]MDW8413645.1 serine/threonine-protein kinase [Acidobacteriota bacterium]
MSNKDKDEYYDSLVNREIKGTKSRYKLNRKIGVGGMGAVFEAINLTDNSRVAIKTISPQLAHNQTFVRRFQREAKVGWILSHPNIIKVYEFGETGDSEDKLYFMAMEFVEGESLRSYLRSSGPLAPTECLEILRPLCEGLEAAHKRKLLHRDLKPDNIMLSKTQDGKWTVKLADFGLVKLLEPDSEITKGANLTQAGEVFGTPHYMAPEQVLGHQISPASDIYALGVITYQMLTGKLPVEGSDIRQLLIAKVSKEPPLPSEKNPSVHKAFDPVLKKALARSPEDRYFTVGDFFKDFQKVVIRLSDTGELKISQEALADIRKEYFVEDMSSNSQATLIKQTTPEKALPSSSESSKTKNLLPLILGGILLLLIAILVIIFN